MTKPPSIRMLLLLAVIAVLVAGCGGTEWRELKFSDGGFRILMQGDPRVEKRELDTPVGKIAAHWYAHEAKDVAFGVGYSDYPAQFLRGASQSQLFTIVREGWMKRINGTLQGAERAIRLEGKYPGTEFTAAGKLDGRDAYLRGRFYLVDNRLYQVVVFGNRTAMVQSDIDHFLESFMLVPRQEPAATVIIETTKDRPEPPAKQ